MMMVLQVVGIVGLGVLFGFILYLFFYWIKMAADEKSIKEYLKRYRYVETAKELEDNPESGQLYYVGNVEEIYCSVMGKWRLL